MTSLVDAQLLFAIVADEIHFSSNLFWRFASAQRFKDLMQKAKRFDSDFVEQVSENPKIFEYQKVLEILDQYLPVHQLADKIWFFDKLRVLGLLLNTAQQDSFRALYGGD